MFEDDDYDFEMTEAEEWYDNNLRYFDWKDKPLGIPFEVEMFYYSVYKPFMEDLKKPITEMVERHYPFIGTETRPAVLERIGKRFDFTGHEFLLFLRLMMEYRNTGIDLREKYPDLDKWAECYPTFRKPRYLDHALWDKMEWLTPEMKAELIAESIKDADEAFEFREKPRSEFFALLQRLTFQYYPEVLDMDSDGWTLFEVFLFQEYTNYQLDFEHYDGFIEYGFEVADLDIPYAEYSKKFSEKWRIKDDEERRQKEEESK